LPGQRLGPAWLPDPREERFQGGLEATRKIGITATPSGRTYPKLFPVMTARREGSPNFFVSMRSANRRSVSRRLVDRRHGEGGIDEATFGPLPEPRPKSLR
jgi:hypothetical protein